MKFAIQINASPARSDAAMTGYQFSKAALAAGHAVVRIFFYHDGVHNAFIPGQPGALAVPDWPALARDHAVELVFCSVAAERRGLLSADTAADELTSLPGFQAGGLGLWVDACLKANRIISFGG